MPNPSARKKPLEALIFQAIASKLGEDPPFFQITIETPERRLVYDIILNIEETLKH
jgi:hypothetical protein